MSKPLPSAYVVASGNLLRAVTAISHAEAAVKAILAHHFDPEDEALTPGIIIRVLKEGDHFGDTLVFLTEAILAVAKVDLKPVEHFDAPAPETEEMRRAYTTIPEGGIKFAAYPKDVFDFAARLEQQRNELRDFLADTFDFPGEFHDSDIVPVTTTGWHIKEARRLANPQPNLKSDTK